MNLKRRLYRPDIQATWATGHDHEAAYWREYFKTKGEPWPNEYIRRLDPTAPLEPYVARYLPDPVNARVLDVGAGPLTSLGKTVDGQPVSIEAVDALADIYDQLIAEAQVNPPVTTKLCDTENLTGMFDAGTFDVVHARNTLDHSYDTVKAIREMGFITKAGGVVLLDHYANEAEHASYEGMHQWNLSVKNGRPIASRPATAFRTEVIDLADHVQDILTLESADQSGEPGMDFVVFRRLPV